MERKAAQQKAIKLTTQKTAAYKDLTADMQQHGNGAAMRFYNTLAVTGNENPKKH